MNLIKAIVVDDEFYNRELISKFVVKTNSNYQIIGMAENIDEAFQLINELKPDLLFLDIKMPGGSGFDLLRKFEKPDFEVVFITGFDEYAIQAFEFNALDYVLKPIDIDKLKVTLLKVYERICAKQSITNQLQQIIDTYNIDYTKITKIPIHHNNEVKLIDVNTIVSFKSDDGSTLITTSEFKKFNSAKHLTSFEFIVEGNSHFCKINKGVYINLSYIKSYSKGSVCTVKLIDDSEFEISRRKKTEILSLLERLSI